MTILSFIFAMLIHGNITHTETLLLSHWWPSQNLSSAQPFLWSGNVKNLSLMSGSVAGADMYIPGSVTRAGYYIFQGILL